MLLSFVLLCYYIDETFQCVNVESQRNIEGRAKASHLMTRNISKRLMYGAVSALIVFLVRIVNVKFTIDVTNLVVTVNLP